jgi:hypothetical protein
MADAKAAYSFFENMNSRGLEVNLLDKAKATIMRSAFENSVSPAELKGIENDWAAIHNELESGNLEEVELLKYVVNQLREDESSKWLTDSEVLQAVRKATKNGNGSQKISKRLRKTVEGMNKVMRDQRLKAIVAKKSGRYLLSTLVNSTHYNNETDLLILLEAWQKAIFRQYILGGKSDRTEQSTIIHIGKLFLNDSKKLPQIIKELNRFGIKAARKELKKIVDQNIYDDWQPSELLYLFRRYEESLSGQHGIKMSNDTWEKIWSKSENSSIEHIAPQTIGAGWKAIFGKRDPEDYVSLLGNLVVLDVQLNSTAQNHPFAKKRDGSYKKCHLLQVKEIAEESCWGPDQITVRTKRLQKWIEQEFSLS